MLELLFSKLGAIGAAVLAFIGLWFGYKYQKAQADKAKIRARVAEQTLEVKDDIAKREEKVDTMSPDDVIDYFGGVRRKDDPGKTTTTE